MPEAEEPTTAPVPSHDPTGQVFVVADDADVPESAAESEPRPSALRRATVLSARIVLGCVTLGVIAVVVLAAILIPLPTFGWRAVSQVVTPVATAQRLVCPGGLLRLGSSTGADATTPQALGSARVTSAAVPGAVTSSDFATTDAGTGHTSSAPHLLSTPPAPEGSTAARLSGAQSERVTATDFVGLAAAACTTASAGTWLAGGSTSVGRTTLLLLANPTDVVATVSVQVFGEVGPVTAPGMDGIVVGAESQRVLSIAGFAPDVASPVIHVTSTGGQVSATLEQTTVRGLVPGGLDFVGGQPQPLTTTVIPGVVVSATSILDSEVGQSGYEDLQSTLRLLAPGTRSTTVSITVLAEDGTVTGNPITTQLDGGQVTDLPINNLSDGNYTFVITSRIPVIASVRVSTASTDSATSAGATTSAGPTAPATDFAWMTAAPLLRSSALVSVASRMTPLLHLENPTDAAESVGIDALGGIGQTVTVAPHSATTVTVTAGTSYQLTGFTGLYASVSGTRDGEITSYVVSPPARGDGAVRIYG